MFTDFDWDIPESQWSWFYVSAHHLEYDMTLINPWPIFAEGYDEAMDIFEVLLRMSIES